MYTEPAQEGMGAGDFSQARLPHATWKTVFTGENLPTRECLELLMALSVVPSEPAIRMVEYMCRGDEPEVRRTRLVLKTVAELGFKQPARVALIDEVRKDMGLALCPVDTVLAMRAHYAELPKDETVRIMSKPVEIRGMPCIFAVTRHSRDIMLDAFEYMPNDLLMRHERLIFAKPDEPVRAD